MGFRLEVSGLDELIDNFERAPKEIGKQMQEAVEKSAFEIERDAASEAPVDRGKLRNSINTEVGALTAKVSVGAEYGIFVEEGRKPGGFPPLDPIRKWSQRHGIENWFAVARKIAREGTDPQPFFEPAIDENRLGIEKRFEDLADGIEATLTKR